MILNFLYCFFWISIFILVSGLIWWVHPFKALTWFYHGILGWHKPDDKVSFNGCSFCSTCQFCGKRIMQDSQGNWFEA